MRLSLDILPVALADIAEAARRYEHQRKDLGHEFIAEVNRRIDELANQALIFRIRYRRKGVRWTYPRRFPYRICFYIEGQGVHVFAVIHAARHHREWRQRL